MRWPRPGEEVATVGIVSGGHLLSHFYVLTLPPLFPLLRADFGLNNTQLGLVLSAIALPMLLQVPVGGFVDRVGAKRVFVAGVAITSTGIVLAGVSTSYLPLLAFAALSGIGQSAFHPADYPLIESVSDPDQKGRNFSVHTFGGFAGFAVAPLIVGTLGIAHGWRTALLVVGAAGLAYAGFAAVSLRSVYQPGEDAAEEGTEGTGSSGRGSLLRPGILIMAAFFSMSAMAGKGVQAFTAILAVNGFSLAETVGNTSLTAFFTAAAVGILVGGVLADRYDPRWVIAPSTAVTAAVMFVVAGETVPIGPMALVVLFGVAGGAYGLVAPSRDRLVSANTAAGSTGRSFGLVFTAAAVGTLIGPTLFGAVIDFTTVRDAFVLIGAFFLFAGLITLAIGTRIETLALRPSRWSK